MSSLKKISRDQISKMTGKDHELTRTFELLLSSVIESFAIRKFVSTGLINTDALADDRTILCDSTLGSIILNLPPAAQAQGKIYTIKKIDSSANVVAIDPNGSEKIDGVLNKTITTQWEALTIHCDGQAWYIIGDF